MTQNLDIHKKEVKFYNIIFPGYLLWLAPQIWLVAVPASFIVDSVVILLSLYFLESSSRMTIYKKVILKVWGYGFLADLVSILFLLAADLSGYAISAALKESERENIKNFGFAIKYNPYFNIFALIITILAIFISGFCIYLFNMKCVFKNIDMKSTDKKRLALLLAVFTAPYAFLIPANLLF